MKYINPIKCSALLLVVGLAGCATNRTPVSWNYDGSEPVDLLTTEQFLPVQQRNETGNLLDYQATPNPYREVEARIDKETVTTYIDARRAFNARKYAFAENLLAELVEKEPDLSGPWVMRGDIAAAQDKLDQAVEHYITAIEIKPINFNAWLRLAKVQRMRGHFNHAQNTYARALHRWPDGAELHLNLGVLYDVYLNMPLKAQAHMEAYQLLNGGSNGDVTAWLEEIRQRTGLASTLPVVGPNGEPEQLPSISQSEPDTPENAAISTAQQARELAASQVREE